MENNFIEIDEGTDYVGYEEAFNLIRDNIHPVGIKEVSFDASVGRVAARDIVARVSYPTSDVSLKDGFAVKSGDVARASVQQPVCLGVTGSVFAGSRFEGEVTPGNAVKICSGAPIPVGAEAVVSGEFCEESGSGEVYVRADAEEGRNILRAGSEVKAGAVILKEGNKLTPGYLGLAAAAGNNNFRVYQRPKVAVIGIGDEVIAPGEKLETDQLYASNLVTMGTRLSSFNIPYVSSVVIDSETAIEKELIKNILLNDKIYVLHPNEFTIFLWMPDNHCTCWVHTAILKEGRGKKAIIAGKKAIRWMFENTKYLKLITWIPSFNKQAELYSKWCGFIKEGCSKKSFLKNGILYDQYLYGLTKEY